MRQNEGKKLCLVHGAHRGIHRYNARSQTERHALGPVLPVTHVTSLSELHPHFLSVRLLPSSTEQQLWTVSWQEVDIS